MRIMSYVYCTVFLVRHAFVCLLDATYPDKPTHRLGLCSTSTDGLHTRVPNCFFPTSLLTWIVIISHSSFVNLIESSSMPFRWSSICMAFSFLHLSRLSVSWFAPPNWSAIYEFLHWQPNKRVVFLVSKNWEMSTIWITTMPFVKICQPECY